MKYLNEVVGALLEHKLRRATKFVSPSYVIRAHRIFAGDRIDNRDKAIDIRLKIGTPNFHERKFIKDCLKAGEPFPVKKIRFAVIRPPKRKAKKKSKR